MSKAQRKNGLSILQTKLAIFCEGRQQVAIFKFAWEGRIFDEQNGNGFVRRPLAATRMFTMQLFRQCPDSFVVGDGRDILNDQYNTVHLLHVRLAEPD